MNDEKKKEGLTLDKALKMEEFYVKLRGRPGHNPIYKFKESGWFWCYCRKVHMMDKDYWQIRKIVSPKQIRDILLGREYILSEIEMKDPGVFSNERD